MDFHKRTLVIVACVFGMGLYLVYLVPTNIGKLKWVSGLSIPAVSRLVTPQTLPDNSSDNPVVSTSLAPQTISNISTMNLVLKPVGFLEFQKDNFTLKELITKSCKDKLLVPPLVHYVWLSKKTMLFHEYVGMLSASQFLKPCYILIHGDTIPSGEWWDMLLSKVKNLIYVHRPVPTTIYGKKIRYIEHKADIARLEILLEHGGIYADTDMYFLRSFDPLRKHELTLSRETGDTVANGLIVASKESVLLKMWHLTYHKFDPGNWAANSVKMASKLCLAFPDMVHMESGLILLGPHFESVYKENVSWGVNRYSVHLYARYFNKYNFTMENINKLNTTFGSLSRFVLFGKPDIR